MIIRSFRKCGISVAIDGSEDSEINISGLDGYEVGESDSESTEDEDDDPFADVEDYPQEEEETTQELEDTNEEEEDDTQEEEEDAQEVEEEEDAGTRRSRRGY